MELHLAGLAEDGIRLPKPRLRSIVPRAGADGVDLYTTVEVTA
jgi:hypothetical protein